MLLTPLVTLSSITDTALYTLDSSTTSTGVNVATTARWSAVGVTPTSITMGATALGMLWCSVGLRPSDCVTITSITAPTMLALCSSLHEYEHTNHHHALCIRCGPHAESLCVHTLRVGAIIMLTLTPCTAHL